MSPSGAEYIKRIRAQIEEVDPSEVKPLVGNGVPIIDVREAEEYAVAHLPGAKHVPRGYLESRIAAAAAAGGGPLGIVDDAVVDLSIRQRQVIHKTAGVGVPKVDSAEEAVKALNPDVNVVKYQTRLDASNIMEIIDGYDVIVDGVDNFPTRYLLNDASVRLKIPVVSAAILGFEGQLSVFAPYEGPCYRCLFRQPPPAELAPSCGANGVLGVLPGTMGLLQATEVIKLILGEGDPLIGRPLMYDALAATVTEVKVRRDPDCPICSRHPEEIADEELGVFPDYEAFCAAAG